MRLLAYQSVSLANYRDFRDNVSEFSGLAAYQGIGANITGGIEYVSIGGQLVTGNYFDVLGVDQRRLSFSIAKSPFRQVGLLPAVKNPRKTEGNASAPSLLRW